ncbi:NEDD8 ultimate buster 1-like [Glossina fuscipes]|uniref:NEDD8 ultimate buster 1-like n=1 Tax=Glossina fuscipes TaxID=7396 RepID=A0A8U0WJQ6_9MUSC|nr:NEDD8 ultimate buster 1-like [Glossina fuscipes]
MSKVDVVITRVRARLQELGIKLWLEPYYLKSSGSVETEIVNLAEDFSHNLGISKSDCKLALSELQEGALRKLKAREEFLATGIATFTVRRINNWQGTQSIVEVKCPLSFLGSELQKNVAKALNIENAARIKCISAGKIVNPEQTLIDQNIKNNQQLMVIISEVDKQEHMQENVMHDRIQKIKKDVEAIVDSNKQLFEMEDQDGNPVFLPPTENRAILIGMGICEKGRVAMKNERYDEALILFLEADEKFTACNSKFLEAVDNYALINLDIVWCYLCLKNVTQLPDAQRRLEICENSFRRSYGENLQRLITLKGDGCAEKALIMRLHLLQGVVLFHQNRRNEALEKLDIAENELLALKVDDTSIETLVEMGYEPHEARLGLRARGGDIEQAINFIHDQHEKLRETRKHSQKERKLNQKLDVRKHDKNWVNPRSVCSLMEMGYSSKLVVQALRDSRNDLNKALNLLQNHTEELSRKLPLEGTINIDLMEQLQQLGFSESRVRIALEATRNNLESAIDFLVKMYTDEKDLSMFIERMTAVATDQGAPSTSTGLNSLAQQIVEKAAKEIESLNAYNRFKQDFIANDFDYLDLPLIQEEQILAEYKHLLK